ncbi:MAG: response regulator [Magnetospirillum sp. WYHS-4]
MAKLPAYVLEKLRFLIIDDDPHMRDLVANILRSIGVNLISEAADGADALVVMRATPPDIVICDWMMAPVDGIEFVRILRTAPDSPNAFVPVIMLSGFTELHRVMEARDAGVTEFLAKPVSATTLYGRICSVIEKPRQFVQAARYRGPDRRRRRDPFQAGVARRQEDQTVAEESGVQISQDEIDKMLAEM